jgi:hypothetical protein
MGSDYRELFNLRQKKPKETEIVKRLYSRIIVDVKCEINLRKFKTQNNNFYQLLNHRDSPSKNAITTKNRKQINITQTALFAIASFISSAEFNNCFH